MPVSPDRRDQIKKFARQNPFETQAFKKRSKESQNLIESGIQYGAVSTSVLTQTEEMNAVEDKFGTARHEKKHALAIMPGATLEGVSIIPTSEYRGVTRYKIDPSIDPIRRARIILVASLASGAEDNIPYKYSHSGRDSDEAQAAQAGAFLARYTRSSIGSVMTEGRSLASAYVSILHEESVWRLVSAQAQ